MKGQPFQKSPVTPRKLAKTNKEDAGLVKEVEGKEQHGNSEIVKAIPTDSGKATGKGHGQDIGTISDGRECSVSVKEQEVLQPETTPVTKTGAGVQGEVPLQNSFQVLSNEPNWNNGQGSKQATLANPTSQKNKSTEEVGKGVKERITPTSIEK